MVIVHHRGKSGQDPSEEGAGAMGQYYFFDSLVGSSSASLFTIRPSAQRMVLLIVERALIGQLTMKKKKNP